MRSTVFSEGEYYHIYNRGTDKRKTFLKNADYKRFIVGMEIFNSSYRVTHAFRQLVEVSPRPEDRLVNIVAYCLMPNHFHFLLRQVKEDGVSKFMQKLLTGYTMYFNKRYERTGVLFQGIFKSKHINTDRYLLHVSRYIHLNPLEIEKRNNISRADAARFLRAYRWSSYMEYVSDKACTGSQNAFDIVLGQVGGNDEYKKFCLSVIGKEYNWSRFRLDQDE